MNDFKKLIQAVWDRRAEPIRLIGLGCHLKSEKSVEDSSVANSAENSDQLGFF